MLEGEGGGEKEKRLFSEKRVLGKGYLSVGGRGEKE